MLTIRIGKGLDGPIGVKPQSALGEMTVGPIRLLSWLESQLGLRLPEVSFTSRMVRYLAVLKKTAPGRFFESSLAQDEFGTARTLLQWRDTWYEAGWHGSGFGDDASARLRDMATVESSVASGIPPGVGERVQRVAAALTSTSLDVELVLLDPPEFFSKVWQELFTAIGAGTEAVQPIPQADGETDLGRLQRALIADHEPGNRLALEGDGTVLVLSDGSPQLSAPWVARFAHGQNDHDGSVAILAMERGPTLDDALTNAGFPRLGFADTSYWRPVFQVLPLALELIWRPLDPGVLLQFLTHSMAPIPARIRRPLAEVVARQPGIGGKAWFAVLKEALEKAVVLEPEDTRDDKRIALAAEVGYWLDGERFEPDTGVPVPYLLERVQRVSRWLATAFAAQEDETEAALYSAALGQAEELARTVERLRDSGSAMLTQVATRRLAEAVRGTGTSRPGRPWQSAPGEPQLLRTDSPAGFIAPVPRVIWWGCDREHLPGQYPWSRAEREELARHGVELLPLDQQLAWQAGTWLRPILSAQAQLVLVLHDNANGHHPVFDEIVAVAEGWAEARVDELMRDPARVPAGDGLPATAAVPLQLLPRAKRWWQLSQSVGLPARERESFSSLEKFLFGPHRWVLDYQARIRPGALEALDEGALLKGNLAHALFEDFFGKHADIAALDAREAARWARSHAETLIEQAGAVLSTPGRQAEKEHFIGTASNALEVLIAHLQSAGVAEVTMETELSGRFVGGAVGGTIDLIATKASGDVAVLDLKWGGFTRRRNMLLESDYLQLAVYAQLVHQNHNQWPALGYFIVSDARLLSLASDYFPGADVAVPENGESVLQFWKRVEQTWKWRRKQLDAGIVEVPVTGTHLDEASYPDEPGLPMPETFDAFDDYWALTGWSDES